MRTDEKDPSLRMRRYARLDRRQDSDCARAPVVRTILEKLCNGATGSLNLEASQKKASNNYVTHEPQVAMD